MIPLSNVMLFQKHSIKHPQIVKYYTHWTDSLTKPGSPLTDEIPWLNYGAIDWLDKKTNSTTDVFEWGSGGSTLFLSKRARSVVTIEHNPKWYGYVCQALVSRNVQNVSIHLVEGKALAKSKKAYLSTDMDSIGKSFSDYASSIDKFPDSTFDIVIVDGRARNHCINHAISKIKTGGHLILDNAERDEYQAGIQIIDHWPQEAFTCPGPYLDYPWTTKIWTNIF